MPQCFLARRKSRQLLGHLLLANCYHLWLQWKHFFAVRLRLGYRKWMARLSSRRTGAVTHSWPT